jgi:hypothetical protein
MTFWKTEKQNQPSGALVKETIQTIRQLQVPVSIQESPEWACVTKASEALDLPVLAIALEVLASHHSKNLKKRDLELIEAVADCIRCGRTGEMRALVELVRRFAGDMRQAA